MTIKLMAAITIKTPTVAEAPPAVTVTPPTVKRS